MINIALPDIHSHQHSESGGSVKKMYKSSKILMKIIHKKKKHVEWFQNIISIQLDIKV